jgi:hypothetical protein
MHTFRAVVHSGLHFSRDDVKEMGNLAAIGSEGASRGRASDWRGVGVARSRGQSSQIWEKSLWKVNWNATSDTLVKRETIVQIVAVEGLTTKVEPET